MAYSKDFKAIHNTLTSSDPTYFYQIAVGPGIVGGMRKMKNIWVRLGFSMETAGKAAAGFYGLMLWPSADTLSDTEISRYDSRLLASKPFVVLSDHAPAYYETFLKGINVGHDDRLYFVVKAMTINANTNVALAVKYVQDTE